MKSARLFIRDDDVWTLDKKFRFFFDLAIDHNLPVVYAVIPAKMDKGLVRFLRRAKEKTPHLLDIVQHGWRHLNHSTDDETKYEFGASRSVAFQREDIRRGFKKIRLAFGEHFTPAFVPPYHGYDERTLRILQKEGFQIFSAGSRRLGEKFRLVELPAEISFSRYDKDGSSINTATAMVGMLARDIYRRPVSGILTHHADFTTAASRRELMRFFDHIVMGTSKMGWRVLLFSDIMSGFNGSQERKR